MIQRPQVSQSLLACITQFMTPPPIPSLLFCLLSSSSTNGSSPQNITFAALMMPSHFEQYFGARLKICELINTQKIHRSCSSFAATDEENRKSEANNTKEEETEKTDCLLCVLRRSISTPHPIDAHRIAPHRDFHPTQLIP